MIKYENQKILVGVLGRGSTGGLSPPSCKLKGMQSPAPGRYLGSERPYKEHRYH